MASTVWAQPLPTSEERVNKHLQNNSQTKASQQRKPIVNMSVMSTLVAGMSIGYTQDVHNFKDGWNFFPDYYISLNGRPLGLR